MDKTPQEIMSWFNVHNPEHMLAYKHLQQTGVWPEWFDVGPMSPHWQVVILNKMADAWVERMIEENYRQGC